MDATTYNAFKDAITSTQRVHAFEAAGLGKAPFKYTGYEPVKGSTCQFCGTAIKNKFYITSSDGRTSWVGCNCIEKSGDDGLISVVHRVKAELAAQIRKDKVKAVMDEYTHILATRVADMQSLPSLNKYSTNLYEFATSMLRYCGAVALLVGPRR